MSRTLPILLVALTALTACGESDAPAKACAVAVGDSPVRGSDEAWVTIVEFADFECPACAKAAATLDLLAAEYATDVRLAFKHFPVPAHSRALPAALAAECAGEQGRFWEMYALLFDRRPALSDAELASYAAELGLDGQAFAVCRASSAPRARITRDQQLGISLRIAFLPALFINDTRLYGAWPLDDLRREVEAARAKALDSGLSASDYYDTLVQSCP